MSTEGVSGTGDGPGVLNGLKVADFSTMMAGPYCTRLLADLGADVVKIESPTGDMVRTAPPLRDGRSAYWGSLNVGKRSVVIDLKRPEGREAAAALVDWADVVVENFRPGVMTRFGLDYATVGKDRPALVYCSISGYGQSGPWVGRPANAQAIQATSGYDLATLSFQTGISTPLTTGIFAADALGGALAFGAVLAALRARDESGQGRHVDLALLDGVLSLMTYEVQAAQFPVPFDRQGYPPARTSDGWVMIAAMSNDQVRKLFGVIGRPELADDERFATTEARWAHIAELRAIVDEWTIRHTSAECEEIFNAAGVASSRYFTVAEVLESEQLKHRGNLVEAEDGSGPFAVIDTPFQLTVPGQNGPGPAPTRRAADPGADTRAVLTDLLGDDRAEAVLTAGGALSTEEGMS